MDAPTIEEINTLMAEFGMATWLAQSLEQAVIVWTVAVRLVHDGAERRDGDANPHFASLAKRTLGKLVGPRLDEVRETDAEFAQRLSSALDVRNDLIHRFHRRHAAAMISKPALDAARLECAEACELVGPLIADIVERTTATGVEMGGVNADELMSWASRITRESLDGELPRAVVEQLTGLFSEANET